MNDLPKLTEADLDDMARRCNMRLAHARRIDSEALIEIEVRQLALILLAREAVTVKT